MLIRLPNKSAEPSGIWINLYRENYRLPMYCIHCSASCTARMSAKISTCMIQYRPTFKVIWFSEIIDFASGGSLVPPISPKRVQKSTLHVMSFSGFSYRFHIYSTLLPFWLTGTYLCIAITPPRADFTSWISTYFHSKTHRLWGTHGRTSEG